MDTLASASWIALTTRFHKPPRKHSLILVLSVCVCAKMIDDIWVSYCIVLHVIIITISSNNTISV